MKLQVKTNFNDITDSNYFQIKFIHQINLMIKFNSKAFNNVFKMLFFYPISKLKNLNKVT